MDHGSIFNSLICRKLLFAFTNNILYKILTLFACKQTVQVIENFILFFLNIRNKLRRIYVGKIFFILHLRQINFVGNIEGTNALTGDCDVLVADGFAGNQVLKNSEGIARRIITDIVKYAKMTGNTEMMKLVKHLMGIYDFNSLGGAIILGAGKPVIKAHGAANEYSVVSTVGMILNLAKNKKGFD